MLKVAGGLGGLALSIGALIAVGWLFLFGIAGCNNFSRHQALLDAKNEVKKTAIQIQNQQQRVKIAKQHAQIRYQNSIGIREAQDEIAKTLTPLYVQFEMTQALQQIALSGKNNTIIYLPTDPKSGLPVVPTSNAPTTSVPGK